MTQRIKLNDAKFLVRKVHVENHNTRTFVLEPFDRSFSYRAGQFVTLDLPVGQGETVSRSYSLSTCPDSDLFPAITVKRELNGHGSTWIFENVDEGQVLQGTQACGTFHLDDSGRPIQMFAAGVGVTPIFSLLKSTLATTRRKVRLHYSISSPADQLFVGELEHLAQKFPERTEFQIRDTSSTGRLDIDDARKLLRSDSEIAVFACGPGPFVDLVRNAAALEMIDPDRVRFEAFSPPTTTNPKKSPDETSVVSADVEIAGRSTTIEWPTGSTLTETLHRNAVASPYSCRQGECLACECVILQGAASMIHNGVLDDDDIKAGFALACQLIPDSNSSHVRIKFP